MGGVGPGVQPLSYPQAASTGKGKAGNGSGGFRPSLFSRGRTSFPSRIWGRAPSRQNNITHQSSHPLALHLLVLLPPPLLPPPRSHWVHQPLPGIWGRNRQTDSSPCRDRGMVRTKSQAATGMEEPEPSCPTSLRLAPEDLVAAVAATFPLTAV